jgi:hypothetical protein
LLRVAICEVLSRELERGLDLPCERCNLRTVTGRQRGSERRRLFARCGDRGIESRAVVSVHGRVDQRLLPGCERCGAPTACGGIDESLFPDGARAYIVTSRISCYVALRIAPFPPATHGRIFLRESAQRASRERTDFSGLERDDCRKMRHRIASGPHCRSAGFESFRFSRTYSRVRILDAPSQRQHHERAHTRTANV